MRHTTLFVSILIPLTSTGLVSAEESPEVIMRKSIQATGGEGVLPRCTRCRQK